MTECPDAFILENLLRRHHWGRDFVITNAMAAKMPEGGWTRKRLAMARGELEHRNRIQIVRPAGYKTPARYRWSKGWSKLTTYPLLPLPPCAFLLPAVQSRPVLAGGAHAPEIS